MTFDKKIYNKAYYKDNMERVKAKSREYYRTNKEDMNAKNKAYRILNKESIAKKDKARKQRTRYRSKIVKEFILFKGGKCKCCGYKYDGFNGGAFNFHHRNPGDKYMCISILSKKAAYKELEKCDLLCANCHGIIHYGIY